MSAYTEGEVAWLLGLEEDEARGYDDGLRSALQDSAGGGEPPVPVAVRWHEVQAAKRRVEPELGPAAIAAAEMVGQGASQLEVADRLHVSQRTVGRRVHVVARAIVELLGGDPVDVAPAVYRTPMCLCCGKRPRARAAERRMRVAGRRVVLAERDLAVCDRCAARNVRLVTDRRAA